jgi:hypothetical protein
MVLSWFQDVSIIRKVVELGANVDMRDNAGRTALEHALLSCEKHFFFGFNASKLDKEWNQRFRIAFELLCAGVNPSNTDNCKCPCSPHGCTLVRCVFPQIYSHRGRVYNLVGIPWFIELFLLLGWRSQGTALTVLIKSLYRRQRFDELGLTHTCCLAQQSFSNAPYNNPYSSASDAENQDVDALGSIDAIGVQRIEEIADEEEELRDLLEVDCERFEAIQELPHSSGNTTLLGILTRRAVFIKSGMEEAALKSTSRRKRSQIKQHVKQPVSKYSHVVVLKEN